MEIGEPKEVREIEPITVPVPEPIAVPHPAPEPTAPIPDPTTYCRLNRVPQV